MDLISVLPAFLLAVLAIVALPGPAMALILRRAAVYGGRATVPLVLGLETGLFLWALAAALGLAALVAVSEVAYAVLRVAGAAVLVVLGALALRAAWRARREARTAEPGLAPTTEKRSEPPPRGLSARRAFVEGVVTNLANPKAAVFMVAFFPQFIPRGYPVLATTVVLATLEIIVETALYCSLAFGVGRARHIVDRPAVRSSIDAVSGTILLGLGLKVATTARTL
jgi:threonine/homoserine/homoserine lactone efflux protein